MVGYTNLKVDLATSSFARSLRHLVEARFARLKSLEYTFGLGSQVSECFDRTPVRILLDVRFRVFRFFFSVF